MRMNRLSQALAMAGLVTAAIIAMPGTPEAQTIACDTVYRVKPGDSLTQIARDAYGETGSFQLIYSANAAAIGPNPEVIRVGQVLQIPCIDGAAPSVANTGAIRRRQTTQALPPPEPRQIRVVVGTDWAPFTNEDQEQGGLATEITNVALSMAEAKPSYKIDFINDWGAHLQPLISDHAYDFSIAWFRPNCDVIERLGDESQFRCNNLDWSEPIFEQIVGYYTRADHPKVIDHKALFGLKVCRPSGYALFMMEEHNLVEPNITLVRPNSPTDCFEALDKGDVDAVVLAVDVAEGAIIELGLAGRIAAQQDLSYVATMHAVIAKTNPRVSDFLAQLNDGLRKLKESGEWFRIVVRHMAEHKSKTQ